MYAEEEEQEEEEEEGARVLSSEKRNYGSVLFLLRTFYELGLKKE